jgi:hypothetical protein
MEVIVFVDEHEPLTYEQQKRLDEMTDCLVIRKHSKYYRGARPFGPFNDINYIQAFSQARGEYVVHFDQDMAAFQKGGTTEWMKDLLDTGTYNFVCYPSANSPAPCHAPEYENKWWASTRFFFCKREMIDITALERAVRDNEWFYSTYDRPPRINPWTEQFLGVMGDYKVYYPPVILNQWAVFPWMTYKDGLLAKMNGMPYEDIHNALLRAGGSGIFWDGVDANLLGI